MDEFLGVVTELFLMCSSAAYNVVLHILGKFLEALKSYADKTTYDTTLTYLRGLVAQSPSTAHMISAGILINMIWRFLKKRAGMATRRVRGKANKFKRGISRNAEDFINSFPPSSGSTARLMEPRRDVIDLDYEEYEEYEEEDFR